MEHYTRRAVLKGLALGSAALVSAGSLAACAPAREAAPQEAPPSLAYAKRAGELDGWRPIETDVLVIGGGGAGLCTALSAAEQGASVVICEKMSAFGGATTLSSGKIPAVGTAQQLAVEDGDSIGACAMDIMRPSNYSVRPDLVYTVAERSRDIVEWTEALGAVWSVDSALYFGQTAHRMHTTEGAGGGLTDALIAAMEADPAIEALKPCEMRGLILADDSDAVVGAYGKAGSEKVAVFAENTVLATSGFANNADMLERHCPEAAPAVKVVAPGATGEGILWAEELGAALRNMGATRATPSTAWATTRRWSRGWPTTAASS